MGTASWARVNVAVGLVASATLAAAPAAAAERRPGAFTLLDGLAGARADRPPEHVPGATAGPRVRPVGGSARAASVRLVIAATPASALPGILRALPPQTRVERRLPALGIAAVLGDLARVRAALTGRRGVAAVEREPVRRLAAEPLDAIDPDTGRPWAWHLAAVRADAALALVPGGRGARVGIVDTGVDDRQVDLAPVLAATGAVVPGDPRRDRVGHGTFVAGIVAAVVDGHGTRGVAGPTPLVIVKANRAGEVRGADAAAAVVWAVDHGARVLNLSYSAGCPLGEAERRSLAYALRHDVLVVAAAGNATAGADLVACPAAWLGAPRGAWSRGLSVGASTPVGTRWQLSNRNRFVSLLAPGSDPADDCKGIASALPVGVSRLVPADTCRTFAEQAGGYPQRWAYAQGTSFAAPVVTAVAALVRRARPALTAQQAADAVVRPHPSGARWRLERGYGVVDAEAAVRAALAYDTVPPALEAFRVVRVGPAAVRVVARAADGAGTGEEPASGPLAYRVDARVGGRWSTLYEGVRAPAGRRALRLPAAAEGRPVVVRVRVVDDRLNEVRRSVRR